jgi:hypothetical protein
MKSIHVVSFVSLLMFAAAPCFAQEASGLHIGIEPSTLYMGIEPSTLQIGVEPSTLHIAIEPSTLHIGIEPSSLYIGVEPSTLHIGIEPSAAIPFPPATESWLLSWPGAWHLTAGPEQLSMRSRSHPLGIRMNVNQRSPAA